MFSIKKYILAAGVLLLINGCSLDCEETSGLTQNEAYSYYANTNKLVSYIYSFLPIDLGSVGGAMMESATDNAVYTWESNSINYLTSGVWSPLKRVDDGWAYWDAIRSANSFLENFDITVLDRFKFNADYDEMLAQSEKFPYEVRLLRAYYFFELAKRYGNIPLLTRTYTQDEINQIKQASFNEVIDFVVKECTEVAPNLPLNQKDFWGDTGRATQGMALALKSRALLYAASPLNNPSNDPKKWELAAKAAYEVIKLGVYQMPAITADPLYATTGGNTMLTSQQLIFERRDAAKTFSFEARNEPMGYEGAQGGNTPTQNLVDAYEMKDGAAFDWTNPTHVSNIYFDAAGNQTRDPRLYLNVLTNGSTWLKQKVETFEGGKHAVLEGSTRTGYYLRKYMNPSVSLDPVKPNKIEHHYILFRYAEVLLNFAEAMNEWKGPFYMDADIPLSARAAINQIRTAASMSPVTTLDPNLFREKVRNERRIELAMEGHRFWDIRRWKIAGQNEVRNVYGVQIVKKLDGSLTYQKMLLQQNYWNDKMYRYPYPQNELYMNPNLKQNEGW